MVKREEMDCLIRQTLSQAISAQEPSEGVRETILAKAAAHCDRTEQVVGTSIPPLVPGLRDTRPATPGAARLPEFEAELMDFFGSAQQRLVSVWLLSTNNRY